MSNLCLGLIKLCAEFVINNVKELESNHISVSCDFVNNPRI